MNDVQRQKRLIGVSTVSFALVVWYVLGGGIDVLAMLLAVLAIGGCIFLRRSA